MSLLFNAEDRFTALGRHLVKLALDAPEPVYALAGKLYLSSSGWLLLAVPNGLVRSIYENLDEVGAELPPGKDGQPFNAHISVMRPEEVEQIGGADVISERGHVFHYNIGRLATVNPAGWDEMSKCWLLQVSSPELMQLRRSYGLASLPQRNGESLGFHITVAVKRKGVLRSNEISKVSTADREVTTYIPRTALASVRKHGLLSGKALLSNPEALAAAASGRGEDKEQFRSKIEEVLAGWKPDSASGPNVLFSPPPDSVDLHAKHPSKTMDLLMVSLRLSKLLRDVPGTRVHGQELMPYVDYMQRWTPEQLAADQDDPSLRHRDLSPEELTSFLDKDPTELWKNYADPEGRGMYAPDVPHAAVVTPDGTVPTKYLRFPKTATDVNGISRVLQAARDATDTEPTEAQREAGNYAKGKFRWKGLEISLENPKGSTRSGVSPDGKEWSNKMVHDYGYIKGTTGSDDDHVDVFIGPDLASDFVVIINQVDPATGKFDEHKVMFGFSNEADAIEGYLANYDEGWQGMDHASCCTIRQFKWWLEFGDLTKMIPEDMFAKHRRKAAAEDGTLVAGIKVKEIYDPICPHCDQVMYEKHFVPDRENEGLWRHRGDCYDKGPFRIEWPDQEERDATYESFKKMWGGDKEASLPPITIDRPKGFKKVFQTKAGPVEEEYPLDYGYFEGHINPQDNEEADVFVGSGGNRHGRYMKGTDLTGEWQPDEHKWYTNLTDDEHANMMSWWGKQNPELVREDTPFADIAELLADLQALKQNKSASRNCPGCHEPFKDDEPYPDVEMCEVCERFGKPKEASVLPRAFAAQLNSPSWNKNDDVFTNLLGNVSQLRERGQNMIREHRNAEAFREQQNPGLGYERLQRIFAGEQEPEDPVDQLVFGEELA